MVGMIGIIKDPILGSLVLLVLVGLGRKEGYIKAQCSGAVWELHLPHAHSFMQNGGTSHYHTACTCAHFCLLIG